MELVEEMFNRIKIPVKQGYGLTEYISIKYELKTGPLQQPILKIGMNGESTSGLSENCFPTWRQ